MGRTQELPPIAIVGMACRLPGDASDVKGLWDMCCDGRNAWSEIPKDRMNVDGFFHPDPSRNGTFNTRGGHFMKEDVGLFDAPFFRISPSEAQTMDPQQRLLLESAYEALENGGISLSRVTGRNIGVYVGASMSDYSDLLRKDPETGSTYQSTGTATSILANRISYVFNLKGPSLTVDTACSSSLTALHLACQGLWTQQTSEAIVGGVYVMLSPSCMIGMSMLRLFGQDGRSFTYDHRGTGYGRGEGVATLVLKPLEDAIRDGDSIRSIIRNIGVNQDGTTNGITFPNKEAQEQLIKSVYDSIQLDPNETGYAEVHGTGTAAGDPVEAHAIAAALACHRHVENPLIVGSVKSNIGHLEAASGLAGVIKTSLALETGLIPPNFNFERANKDIPLDKWKLKVPVDLTPWPPSEVRRASVSSFGFGGTNVHLILEAFSASAIQNLLRKPKETSEEVASLCNGSVRHEGEDAQMSGSLSNGYTRAQAMSPSPQSVKTPESFHDNEDSAQSIQASGQADNVTNGTNGHEDLDLTPRARKIFVLSASNALSCKKQVMNIIHYLKARQEAPFADNLMGDLAYTLDQRRTLLEWRTVVSATSPQELIQSLKDPSLEISEVRNSPRVGMIFTGQGSQWFAMGRELMQYPVFSSSMRDADTCIKGLGAQWSLLDEIFEAAENSRINEAYISQPATCAIQISLTILLSSWGICPSVVAGHSSGEIAAAFATGALPLEICMMLAYHRGRLAVKLRKRFPKRPGGMLAIGAPSNIVERLIKHVTSGIVNVACYNGPNLMTASGDEIAINDLKKLAEAEKLFVRQLRVDVAYHSHHMLDIESEYLHALGDLHPQDSEEVSFYSSLTGDLVNTGSLDAQYWARNMTNPVRFAQAMDKLCSVEAGRIDTLIEVGPHSALEAPTRDILKTNAQAGKIIQYYPTLSRNKAGEIAMLHLVSNLLARGHTPNLSVINGQQGTPRRLLTDLPPYAWAHDKRYWYESRLSQNYRSRKFPYNDLLGSLVDDYNDMEPRWRNVLRPSEVPWLLHHKVQSSTVLPLAGYLAMVIEAAYQRAVLRGSKVTKSSIYRFRQVAVDRSLIIGESAEVETSVSFKPVAQGMSSSSEIWDAFCIYSWTEKSGWVEHCRGLISLDLGNGVPNVVDGTAIMAACETQYSDLRAAAEAACTVFVDIPRAYETFTDAGLEFGTLFQNLQEARACPGQCVGIISIPDTTATMPFKYESDYVVHPATLDACFHPVFMAASGGNPDSSTLHLPTFFECLSVSHGIGRKPGKNLTAYARIEDSTSPRDMCASITVFDPSHPGSWPLIEFEHFVASELQTGEGLRVGKPARGLCYKVQWLPCLNLLQPSQDPSASSSVTSNEQNPTQLQHLERASYYYIQEAISSLTKEDIQRLQTPYQKLYECFMDLLALGKQNRLPYQSVDWGAATAAERSAFLDEVKLSDNCGRMVHDIGIHLVKILRSETDPMSIMLDNDLLSKFYADFEPLNIANRRSTDWIKLLACQNPLIKILEIGAGTGGTTHSILQAVGGADGAEALFGSYDFTDISTAFLEKARDRFRSWGDLVRYSKLDIEDDPVTQGFELEYYDLIIASNVLHATARMDRTLANVRRLLKPGGKLLLVEIVNRRLTFSMVFGTLKGWWLGEEPERRGGPIFTKEQWDAQLRSGGFSGLDDSFSGDELSTGCVMYSTAILTEPHPSPSPVLVYDPEAYHAGMDDMQWLINIKTDGGAPRITTLGGVKADEYCILWDPEGSFASCCPESKFRLIKSMLGTSKGLLWVTVGASSEHPNVNLALGLMRAVRSESGGKLATLDLDSQRQRLDNEAWDMIYSVFKRVFDSTVFAVGQDMEFAERNGRIEIPRLVSDEEKDNFIIQETKENITKPQLFYEGNRRLKLKLSRPGVLDEIYFEDDRRLEGKIKDGDVEISVQAAGMNFKDVMIALGQVPYNEIGLECSGIVTAVGGGPSTHQVGDRVCALMESYGAYASHVRTPGHRVAKIPNTMSFISAASIPVIFTTALHALRDVARLTAGETVLIHAAAGGVGQASIKVAQSIGAEVYASVGSTEKRDFLERNFDIPRSHIFSSRDTTFGKGILHATNDRGVDVILNSVSGEALRVGWECLAPLGRFVEIGKRDSIQNNRLEMRKFSEAASFSAVDVSILASLKPDQFSILLHDVIEMFRLEQLSTVSPIITFPMAKLQEGLRTMQTGKHMGKLVIEPDSEDIVQASVPSVRVPAARSEVSYLITGGTGGLGQSITRWLARQGAKNIILASRSGGAGGSVASLIEELGKSGVRVRVEKCDIADEAQLRELVGRSELEMPRIGGVIHGAMVLRDRTFENTDFNDWNQVVRPRVQGAWNIHNQCPGLDFFVLLGSITGIFGNKGQAAYAATNTFMDAFAAYRARRGLPASTIDLGVITDVGYVFQSDTQRRAQITAITHDVVAETELHALLKGAILKHPTDCSYQQTITGLKLEAGRPLPWWSSDTRFSHIVRKSHSGSSQTAQDRGSVSFRKALKDAASIEEAHKVICSALIHKVSSISMTPEENVSVEKPLVAYGLDSLVAVEIRNWITSELESNVPLLQLTSSPSLSVLAETIAHSSKLLGHLANGVDKDTAQ